MLFKIFFITGFITSTYLFFKTTRDDIKLLSLHLRDETIFDLFFLTSLAVLAGARLVYVVTHFGDFGLSLVKILLFTHFPGFSFIGGLVGGFIFLRWFLNRNNILRARIFDLVTLSCLPLVILSFLGRQNLLGMGVFIILASFLFRIYRRPPLGRLNFPGVISLSFLIVFSIVGFMLGLRGADKILAGWLTLEQVISIIVLILAGVLFARGLNKGYL